jgi:hypothetical protein
MGYKINHFATKEGEICGIRLRRTFFGKFIFQIQRQVYQADAGDFALIAEPTLEWKKAGMSEFRDIRDRDLPEFYKMHDAIEAAIQSKE